MPENKQTPPAALDKTAIRRAFDAAAANYDACAALQQEVGARLNESIDDIPADRFAQTKPRVILDIGAGTGAGAAALADRHPAAHVVAVDISARMLQVARKRGRATVAGGDFERLPIAAAAADMVYSNLSLQWSDNPARVFAEARRVLAAGGVFVFSTFGPDTLKELRAAWKAADDAPRVHPFIDMHDLGDMLLAAGLRSPVMQREEITMTYTRVADILRDLKHIGATNALAGRRRGLSGRQTHRRMAAAYEDWRGADGRLPATWEVIYGAAWAPLAPQGGVAVIPADIGRA